MLSSPTMDVRMVLGKNYVEGAYSSENSPEVAEDFKIIAKINRELFNKIPYTVIFTEADAYDSAREMRQRVIAENTIYIYSGGNNHPFLTKEENLIGRAVHDVFAHMVCGCPFSFQGELNAYYEQRKHYPERVWATLFAEIPMQTAAFYYADKDYTFPQRAIRASQTEMNLVEHLKKDYSHNSVLSVEELLK
jgi:hypothetical protein